MRLLVVSDLFPPLHIGGYEAAAAEVTQGLRHAGHDVTVLTTFWGLDAPARDENGVLRLLRSRDDPQRPVAVRQLLLWDRKDQRTTARILETTRPDAVLLWNAGTLAHPVLRLLLDPRRRALVYVFGDWPLRKHREPAALDAWRSRFAPRSESRSRARLRAAARSLGGALGFSTRAEPLVFQHLAFGSAFMRELFHRGGLQAPAERVIYYGVFGPFARALERPLAPRAPGPLRVLFAGRLWEAKAPHTAIEGVRPPRQPGRRCGAHGRRSRGGRRVRRAAARAGRPS